MVEAKKEKQEKLEEFFTPSNDERFIIKFPSLCMSYTRCLCLAVHEVSSFIILHSIRAGDASVVLAI